MIFELVITERAQIQIDNIVEYIVLRLKNPEAAKSVLEDLEEAYHKLEYSADIFSVSDDPYLAEKGYHKLKLKNHNYIILYLIRDNKVMIAGVFHTLENYGVQL